MTVSIRSRASGRDPVARTHRRAATLRSILLITCALMLVVAGVWLMFASSVFAVTDVQVEAPSPAVSDNVRSAIDEVLGQRRLGYLRPARNILLMDSDAMAASLLSAFGNIERLEVIKEFPHTIRVAVTERTPRGLWCTGDKCQYFDDSGARWGEALPSRGPLLLLVRDERTNAKWDQRLFDGMAIAVAGLPEFGLRPISVLFPDAAPGDMRVSVGKAYDILMDALGDVSDQLSTLGVLVADRSSDPTFRPAYIDIRTPGRAYYK